MNRLALAVLALALLATGCLQGAKTPKRDLVDCYASALQPVAGEVFDVAQLALDLVAGKADLGAVLHSLQIDEKAALALKSALNACSAPAALPDAGTVTQ